MALGHNPSLFWITFFLRCDVWVVFCWCLLLDVVVSQRILLLLPEILLNCEKHHLDKRNQLTENQMSIILMSEVGGRPSILLMKMVVITSIVVKLTLRDASKYSSLKMVVAKVINMRRMEGK